MPDPYFSELKYLGGPTFDFIEVAVDAGSSVANLVVTIYNANGSVRSSNAVSGLSFTTIAGRDVYVIESGSPGSFTGLGKTNAVSLSDSGTVYDFVSFNDNAATVTATAGPANGLTSTEIGMAGAGESLETTDYGATYYVQTSPNSGTIPCLTKGTLLETKEGLIKVENLRAGMQVRTLRGGFETLRLALNKSVSIEDIRHAPKLAPIRILAGALGHDLPRRDLWVSRQHRMLVTSQIAKRMFGCKEVLIAAIHLTKLPGIFIDTTLQKVTYFHLVFDRHCVIVAEGAPTGSLFLGVEALAAVPRAALKEINALFPDVHKIGARASARYIPKQKQQKQLVSRHAKNKRAVLCDFNTFEKA